MHRETIPYRKESDCSVVIYTTHKISLYETELAPAPRYNFDILSVSIIGNPQCYRAADKAKGWSALFCK